MHPINDKFDQDTFSIADTIPKEILENFLKTSADYLTHKVYPVSDKTNLDQNQQNTTQRRK